MLKTLGFSWSDPREIISLFEDELSKYTGAPYVVLTDCCTHALELCLRYELEGGHLTPGQGIEIPDRTYVSVAQTLLNVGLKPALVKDLEWTGEYELGDTGVFDSAARFTSKMFRRDSRAQCLSFQIKKRLPIGRGGAVLTADKALADWVRLASYDGRDLNTRYDSPQHLKTLGFHYYMTPEDAARGLIILSQMENDYPDAMDWMHYPELHRWAPFESLLKGNY